MVQALNRRLKTTESRSEIASRSSGRFSSEPLESKSARRRWVAMSGDHRCLGAPVDCRRLPGPLVHRPEYASSHV